MRQARQLALSLAVLSGCGPDGATGGNEDAGEGDLGADAPPSGTCAATEVVCVDRLILDLALHDDLVSDGEVSNTAMGSDWVTTVDASAGGMSGAPNHPWIYVRFEDEGAVRVDIDDETALERTDWHVSARRYVLRLNGGNSGPSCVAAAAIPDTDYEALDNVPSDVAFEEDDYYTEPCVMIDDGSGLEGSPRTALGPWWSYDGCVKTTMTPFLLRLEDGRVVKLRVDAYYGSGQQECNDTSTPGADGAVYTWRWRFLD